MTNTDVRGWELEIDQVLEANADNMLILDPAWHEAVPSEVTSLEVASAAGDMAITAALTEMPMTETQPDIRSNHEPSPLLVARCRAALDQEIELLATGRANMHYLFSLGPDDSKRVVRGKEIVLEELGEDNDFVDLEEAQVAAPFNGRMANIYPQGIIDIKGRRIMVTRKDRMQTFTLDTAPSYVKDVYVEGHPYVNLRPNYLNPDILCYEVKTIMLIGTDLDALEAGRREVIVPEDDTILLDIQKVVVAQIDPFIKFREAKTAA